MIKKYNSKMIISGDVVEIYKYKDPIYYGFDNSSFNNNRVGRSVEANQENKVINKEKSVKRAKTKIRRLVNANIEKYSKFITLTFADNITDIKTANYEYEKFIKRLSYNIGFKVNYIAVPEFTKKGRVHYHIMMFNLPYIANKELKEIWGNGFLKINSIKEVTNVGAYVCKYMQKDIDDRLDGAKKYYRSRNLKNPIEVKNAKKIDEFAQTHLTDITYKNSFDNEHCSGSYEQYNTIKNTKSQ